MKPTPRKILTRSISAVSEAGNKVVSGALCLVPRRKGEGSGSVTNDTTLDDEETDPAFLATTPEPLYTSEPGCRQAGYFDSIEIDFGITQVQDDGAEPEEDIDTTFVDDGVYELVSFPSPSSFAEFSCPSSPNDQYFPDSSRSPLRGLRRLTSKMRKLSHTLRSKNLADEVEEDLPSPDSSQESLPPIIDDEPPQLARFSFASVASDVTTGTLNRYLSHREKLAKSLEATLARTGGMSILAYEREGSWLVKDDCDPKFVCPFPQCEAHYGPPRSSGVSRNWHNRLRPHVETVYEDHDSV